MIASIERFVTRPVDTIDLVFRKTLGLRNFSDEGQAAYWAEKFMKLHQASSSDKSHRSSRSKTGFLADHALRLGR